MTVVADTTLEMIQGDSGDFTITAVDQNDAAFDLTKAVDGTVNRPAIIRMAAKEDEDDDNEDAIFFKRSYVESEIAVLAQVGATLGQAKVYVDKPDTNDTECDSYRWDCEVTRQDFLRTSAGTITIDADGVTVVGVGTDFTLAKVGDVLQPLGITNERPVLIASIVSATEMTVESADAFDGDEPGIAFEIRRGKSITAGRGPFRIKAGQVK
jgi:hypothetical protein